MDQVQVRFGRPHATLSRLITSRDPPLDVSSTEASGASVHRKVSSPVRRASISRSTMQEAEYVSGFKIETNVQCRSSSEFVPTVITVPKVQKPKNFHLCSPPQTKEPTRPKKKFAKKPPVDQEALVSPPARVLHTLHQRTQCQPSVAFHYQTLLHTLEHSSDDENATSMASRVHKRKREQERWQAAVRWLKDQHLVDAQTKEKLSQETAKRQALADMAKHIREQNQKRFVKSPTAAVAKPTPRKKAEPMLDLPPRKPPVPRLSKRSNKKPSNQSGMEEESKPQNHDKLTKPRRKLKRKVKTSVPNVVHNEEQEARRLEGRKFMELQKKKRQDERRRERLQEQETCRKREEKLQHVEKVRLERLRESIALAKRTKQAEEEVLSAAENLLGFKAKPQESWYLKLTEPQERQMQSNNEEFKEEDQVYSDDGSQDEEQEMTPTESEVDDKSSETSTDTDRDDEALQKLQALKQLTDSLSNRLSQLSQQPKPVEPPSRNWNKATEDLEDRIDSALQAYRSQELPLPSFKPRSLVFCATALSSSSSEGDEKVTLDATRESHHEELQSKNYEDLSQESNESVIDFNAAQSESSGNQPQTLYERNLIDSTKQFYQPRRTGSLLEARQRTQSVSFQRNPVNLMLAQEESSDDDDLDRLIEASRDAYSVVDLFAQELLRQHKQHEAQSIEPSLAVEEINDSDEAVLTSRRDSIESHEFTAAIAPIYTMPTQSDLAESSASDDEQTTELPMPVASNFEQLIQEAHHVLSQGVNRSENEDEPPQEYWDHLLKEEEYKRPRVSIVSDEPSVENHRRFSPRTLSRQLLAAVEFQETLHEAQLHLEALEHAHEIQDTQDETMDWSHSVQRDVDIMCEAQEVLKETLTYQSQAYEEQLLRQAREIAESRLQSQRDISIQTEQTILQDVGTLAAWMQDSGTMAIEARDGGSQCTLKMSVAVQSDHEYAVAEVQTASALPAQLHEAGEASDEEMEDYQSEHFGTKDDSPQDDYIDDRDSKNGDRSQHELVDDQDDGVSEEELPTKVETQDSSEVEENFDEDDVPAQLEKSDVYSEGFEVSVASIEHEDAIQSENEEVISIKEDDQVEESGIYSEKFELSVASKEHIEAIEPKDDNLRDSVIDEDASEYEEAEDPAIELTSAQASNDVEEDFEVSTPSIKSNLQQSLSLEEDYSENFEVKKDTSNADDIVEDEAYESPKHALQSAESVEDNYSDSEGQEIVDEQKEHKPKPTRSHMETRSVPNIAPFTLPQSTMAEVNDRVNKYLLALEKRDEAKAQYIRHILVRKASEDKLLEIRHARTASITSVWQQQQLLMTLDSARMANIAKCYEDMLCFPPESDEEVEILAIAFGGASRPAQFVPTSAFTAKPTEQSEIPASNQEYEDDDFEITAEKYEVDLETSKEIDSNTKENVTADDIQEEDYEYDDLEQASTTEKVNTDDIEEDDHEPDDLDAKKDASLEEDEVAEDQAHSSREAPSIQDEDGGAYSSDDFAEITAEADAEISYAQDEPPVEEDQAENIGEEAVVHESKDLDEMIASERPVEAIQADAIEESTDATSKPDISIDKAVRESKEGSVQYSEDGFEEVPSDKEADDDLDVEDDDGLDVKDDIVELPDMPEDAGMATGDDQEAVNEEYSMDEFASGEGTEDIMLVHEKEKSVASDHEGVEEDEHEVQISHSTRALDNDDEEYDDEYGDDFESNSKKDEQNSKSDDFAANENESSNTSENLRLAMEELSKMPIVQISEEQEKKYERRKAKALELLRAKESAITAGKKQQEIVEIDRLVNYSLQLNIQEEILKHAQTFALVPNSTRAAVDDADQYSESFDVEENKSPITSSVNDVACSLAAEDASSLDEQQKQMVELQATLAIKQDEVIQVQTLVAKEERKLHLQEAIEGLYVQIDQTDRLMISEKDRLQTLQEQARGTPFVHEQNICELSDKEEVIDHAVDAEHDDASLNESFSSENATDLSPICTTQEHNIQADLAESNHDVEDDSVEISVVDGESISDDEEDDASFGSRDDQPPINTTERPVEQSSEELIEIPPLPSAIVPTPEVLDESFTSMEEVPPGDTLSGFDFVEDALPPAWFKESATQTLVAGETTLDSFDYVEATLLPSSPDMTNVKPNATDFMEAFDYIENAESSMVKHISSTRLMCSRDLLTLDDFDYIEGAEGIKPENTSECKERRHLWTLDDFDYIEDVKCAMGAIGSNLNTLDEFDYVENAELAPSAADHDADRTLTTGNDTIVAGDSMNEDADLLGAFDHVEIAQIVSVEVSRLLSKNKSLHQFEPTNKGFEDMALEKTLNVSTVAGLSPCDLLKEFDIVEIAEDAVDMSSAVSSGDLLRDFDLVEIAKAVVQTPNSIDQQNLRSSYQTSELGEISTGITEEHCDFEPELPQLSPIRLQSLVDDIWRDIQDEVWTEAQKLVLQPTAHQSDIDAITPEQVAKPNNNSSKTNELSDAAAVPPSPLFNMDQVDAFVGDLIDGYVDDIMLSLRRPARSLQASSISQTAVVHTRPVYKADPLRDITFHRQEYTQLSTVRKPFDWSAMDRAFIDAWKQDMVDGSSPSSVYRSLPASAISARKQLMADLIQEGSAMRSSAIADSMLSVKDFVSQENDTKVVLQASKQIVQQTLDIQNRLVDSIFNDILDDTFNRFEERRRN